MKSFVLRVIKEMPCPNTDFCFLNENPLFPKYYYLMDKFFWNVNKRIQNAKGVDSLKCLIVYFFKYRIIDS